MRWWHIVEKSDDGLIWIDGRAYSLGECVAIHQQLGELLFPESGTVPARGREISHVSVHDTEPPPDEDRITDVGMEVG